MNPSLKNVIDKIAVIPNLSATETDNLIQEAFSLAKTTQEKQEAGAYLRIAISRRKRPDIDVKNILGETTEMLNLSYIARRYFGKDRTWLYQRLNRSVVNGKPAAFTEAELQTLSDALNKISHIIQQTSTKLIYWNQTIATGLKSLYSDRSRFWTLAVILGERLRQPVAECPFLLLLTGDCWLQISARNSAISFKVTTYLSTSRITAGFSQFTM